MANHDLKESVLLNLRSVTQSCKGGVPFERLQRDYKDLLGSPIPYRELGYNSLEAFIRDIPRVIALKRNNEGQLMAMGVADASTAHIVSLVSRQKSDTKKRPFRKPAMSSGMRRNLTSRYTFREGPRGSHSHYTSSNQYSKAPIPKSAKPKPSKSPPTVQHSKPRTPPEPVPARKYEIAPRFLKLKERKETNSVPREQSPPLSPSSALPGTSSVPSYNSSVIPPPRAVARTLPVKHVDNYRTAQLADLESARTAEEFIKIYSEIYNLAPVYNSVLIGQKAKSKGFVATLKLGDKTYQSYPDIQPTKALAYEEVAKKAMAAIEEQKDYLKILPETPYSNADEIRILLGRIEEIVCEKPSGMFANGIVREYEEKFGEKLPLCWPELLNESYCLEKEELKVQCGKVPEGANIIVRPMKELSSGNRTPSSTSSKTEDLDSKTLKKSLVNISLPKVPEFSIPTGNIWDVYITYVSGWFSARLLDYSDDFLALSEEMSQFYKPRKFSVSEVFENQVYAVCMDDNPNIWHRVIVEEIKDGQISCYFVDEGDVSYVKKENLQEMSPRFLNLPYQAIHLALDGLDEYECCIRNDILEDHLLGKTLIAEVKRWYSIPEFFPVISGIHRTVYSVILYDTSDSSGEDVNLNELLKKSTIESLNCKLPKLSTSSCAYLSHVTQEGRVYLRLSNPQHCWIEQELDRLSPCFEEASAAATKIPLHTMCAAKYESGIWHRAVISENLLASVDPEVVEVFFVDFGHIGVVGKSEICELKPISELLACVPPQAVCCELLNAFPSPKSQWTELATAKLLELAPFDQELIIRVMSEEDENNKAKVNLYKRNQDSNIISINDSLACNPTLFYEEPIPIKAPSILPLRQQIPRKNSLNNNLSGVIPDVAVSAEEQMARRLGTSVSSEKIEWLNTPDNIKSPDAFEVHSPVTLKLPPVPEEGNVFDVFVTLAAHPHNFIVQPLDSCSELDSLMKEMLSFYSSEENQLEMDKSMLRKNDFYAALHSDSNWYRVRIEEIFHGNPVLVAVYYVDFGDINPVCISKLQPLYQKFKQLPCQAIKASLAGIKPHGPDWDPIHCIKFQDIVKEKSFVSVIHKKQFKQVEDGIPSLHLELCLIDTSDSIKDVYIHELLVQKNIAVCL